MIIGIDIGLKSICGVLLEKDKIVNVVNKSIYERKRDCSRMIMTKTLSLIQELFAPQVKGIGLSLLSKVDKKRGVIYDIENIPFWKKTKIKSIIEDTFNVPTTVNTDINCYALGEKYYGICKDFHDVLCITIDPVAETSMIVDNKLYYEKSKSFDSYDCLSAPSYNCVRNYKKSYLRTLECLNSFTENFTEDKMNDPDCKEWEDLGNHLGRLITIMLCNYEPQIILLGGNLAKAYPNYCHYIDKYIEKYVHPRILLNLIIVASMHDNPKPMGAASLVLQLNENVA